MKRLILFITSFSFFISACIDTPEHYAQLEPRSIDVENMMSVLVHVDHGEINILRSDDSQIHVTGQALFPDELDYRIETSSDQISVIILTQRRISSKTPLQVTVTVPGELQVKIDTETANIIGRGYTGDLEVDSVAGNITLQQMNGKFTLHSNRGNITVQDSTGVMSIVGNYGALTTQDVHGETAMSTIMGNITFSGLIADGDTVRLEADHGSVSVNISTNSTLTVQVQSTSGDVACMLPNMEATTRTCVGQLNTGRGSLAVRTVSGAVTLQSIP